MRAYLIRRLFLIIPTLFLVTIIVFLTVRFVPGSLIDLLASQQAGEATMDPEVIAEQIRRDLGLDQPVWKQYLRWLGAWQQDDGTFSGILQGDLGKSLWTHRPILGDIFDKIPISLELGIIAIITALLIAFPIGIYSAIRQDTAGDYVGRSIAIFCMAVPGFWLATMIIVFPSVWWGWIPPVEYTPITENFSKNIQQFIIPAILMGMVMSGVTMRMTRTMMLEVLRQDYIRTAWSKGLRERIVVIRHALKNAMIPVVTVIGLQLPVVIGGTVIMEQIFNLPGMGRFMIDSLSRRDYSVISGINIMMGSVILIGNLLTDLTYGYLDPRIRYR
ncbi:MAG: ABC transporter permease [Dehalococcoidales bacterium]|nr:ABC transporter permease [Dehalococcoidales bacterium]